jgi:small subunit ribosomal protein S1
VVVEADNPNQVEWSTPDEGYWRALLQQGEFANGARPEPESEPNGRSSGLSSATDGRSRPLTQEELQARDWAAAQAAFESEQTVELEVVGHNRGGLIVAWNNLRGFVPASQLLDFPPFLSEEARKAELARRIGQRLSLRVIELDRAANRLIASQRAATEADRRRTVLAELRPGDVRQGTVTHLCDFGAFVDLGGIEGLVHISEISWGRIGRPSDVLHVGEPVEVYVMDTDAEQGRIALSLKRLQPDPWKTVEERYQVGQLIQGTITNVVSFGAFACVEPGLEGLIHISELAEGTFMHPRNVVEEGEVVTALVLSIDAGKRRLALSLRQANGQWSVDSDQWSVPEQLTTDHGTLTTGS